MRCPGAANGRMDRTTWKYVPSTPTMMLPTNAATAVHSAAFGFRGAMKNAASSITPNNGPQTMGIHSRKRIVPLSECARYVSKPIIVSLSTTKSSIA